MKPHEAPDEIRTLLDVYRGKADLSRPEMSRLRIWLEQSPQHREVLQEVQNNDRQILEALQKVPIPAGLKGKVLEALQSSDLDLDSLQREITRAEAAAVSLPQCREQVPAGSQSVRRGAKHATAWTLVIATAGIAAAVFVIISLSGPNQPVNRTVSARDVCLESLQWIKAADNGTWELAVERPGDDAMMVPKGVRWRQQQIQTANGLVDCYLLRLPDGARVFRFEFPANSSFRLPGEFASSPDLPTQRFACSARRQGNKVVVIAVEGGATKYQELFKEGISQSRAIQTQRPEAKSILVGYALVAESFSLGGTNRGADSLQRSSCSNAARLGLGES